MKKSVVVYVALVIAVAFSGCGPKSPSGIVMQGAQSLHLNPPPDGFDRLVICRPWKFTSGGVYSAFLINNTPAAVFRSGCAYFNVKSGKHLVAVKVTDYDGSAWGSNGNEIIVDTRKSRQTIILFDGSKGKLKEADPGFPLHTMTAYEPKNPLITTVHANKNDNIKVVKNKKQEMKEQAMILKYKETIASYIQKKDYSGLKTYVNQTPGASRYIPDYKLRLLFIGPERFQVGDIINYKKKNMSDLLLAAKIRSSKTPYKQFSMEEIVMLQEYKISDTLIAAMLEVTTEIEKEMARDEKQRKLLESQRTFAQKEPQAYSQSAASPGATLATELGQEVGKQVIKGILDSIF